MTQDKERLADHERSERAYEETHGRGGGEIFQERDHPQSYGSSAGGGWRRAMRAYVNGHDRGWEAARKYEVADEQVELQRPGRVEVPSREPTSGAASEEASDEATARTDRGGTPFGVGVPDRDGLVFHRSASIWRDELSPYRRRPRPADRTAEARPGKGDQA